MVAPTRTPQARGVKCDMCKKILETATWLDQTKLAKQVEDAQLVLQLFKQHGDTKCPCIPKNIGNLLVGSTHFEIHRLIAKQLDTQIHRKQIEYSSQARQSLARERLKNRHNDINDCNEMAKTSRFKIYGGYNDKKYHYMADLQLKHLIEAIKFWNIAMQDQANPFNSKLALRLGLTHHVIYACYLFKYYRMLDHQLISTNLLRNLFESIEGVTANAILHANYLYVKTLIDCDQISLARESLKQASKVADYVDISNYESILLTCASCELNLLDNESNYNSDLETLAKLAIIKPDDKLQHYYARTLAISIVIKYIHCYTTRSDLCLEFYHTFRYICAIIRRCYESSFELILSEKEFKQDSKSGSRKAEILDHSWIRFAACDFVFATFDFLSKFYMRSGQPESLELLYNGLNLIVYRNGSFFWQTRLAVIGANLDILCDKLDTAEEKLNAMSHINSQASDHHIMNFMRLELEVNSLSLILHERKTQEAKEVTIELLQRLKLCHCSLMDRISKIELYDCRSNIFFKLNYNLDHNQEDIIVFGGILEHLCLTIIKMNIWLTSKTANLQVAKETVAKLGDQLSNMSRCSLDYNSNHMLLEIMLLFVEIENSRQLLLNTVSSSNLFLSLSSSFQNIESQLSKLTISGQTDCSSAPIKRKTGRGKGKMAKLPALSRAGKRKGNYDVASASQENLAPHCSIRYSDVISLMRKFSLATNEDIVVAYLKNSEPNPDYLLYRQAHELMLCYRLKDGCHNYDQLLYHFSESSTSNTMRYRWMMFEEQRVAQCSSTTYELIKNLSFSKTLAEPDKTQRNFLKFLPEDFKVVQFKYIVDIEAQNEHILIATSEKQNGSTIFAHVERQLLPDDFFGDANVETESLSITNKFCARIEEAKKTLFRMNQRSRLEARKRIEDDISVLLGDLENEWLGPLRFLLCGKINDTDYRKFVQDMKVCFLDIMKNYSCSSFIALETLIENAPLLGREGFSNLISRLFSCARTCVEERECFNKWLKSMETFVDNQKPGLSKIDYLNTLIRGQICFILDKDLEMIPFESLPMMKIIRQGIFRVPSVRLFHLIVSRNRYPVIINSEETAFILDPADNLTKTRQRFEDKLKSHSCWEGTISEPPNPDILEKWFLTKQLYLFIGHGAGTVYYNKLCKGRGLSAMSSIKPTSVVMGCSSGRVISEGPRLEPFGIGWIFIFRGSPCYVGLLWDVTDTDIDNFLDSLLENWLARWRNSEDKSELPRLPITNAICKAKLVCKFKYLVGSTPVVYGLPITCE